MGEFSLLSEIAIRFFLLQIVFSNFLSSLPSESIEDTICIKSSQPFLFFANKVKWSNEQPMIGLISLAIQA